MELAHSLPKGLLLCPFHFPWLPTGSESLNLLERSSRTVLNPSEDGFKSMRLLCALFHRRCDDFLRTTRGVSSPKRQNDYHRNGLHLRTFQCSAVLRAGVTSVRHLSVPYLSRIAEATLCVQPLFPSPASGNEPKFDVPASAWPKPPRVVSSQSNPSLLRDPKTTFSIPGLRLLPTQQVERSVEAVSPFWFTSAEADFIPAERASLLMPKFWQKPELRLRVRHQL